MLQSRVPLAWAAVALVHAGCGSGKVSGTTASSASRTSGRLFTVELFANPPAGVAPLDVAFVAVDSGADGTVTYEWSFGDDSPASTDAAPIHTYAAPGSFTAVVTVTDEEERSVRAAVEIAVGSDDQPAVVASAVPSSGVAPLDVWLSARSAGGNPPLSFAWDFGDGAGSSPLAEAGYTYAAPGTYDAVVTVTDADGDTATSGVTVSVVADSAPSLSSVAAAPATGRAPLRVDFACSAGGGDAPLRFAWTFGDGTAEAGSAPVHTYTAPGAYTATCTVADADGDQESGTVDVVVGANHAPSVAAAASPASGVAPLDVQLTSVVTGGNGELTYAWTFGDGDASTEASPRHTFATPGAYTAAVTVTDEDGDAATALVTVAVGRDGQPEVVATASPASGVAPVIVQLRAAAGGGDAPLAFAWDFAGSGTSTLEDPVWSFQVAGTHSVSVVVTDADGDTATASVDVVVAADATPSADAVAGGGGVAPLGVDLACAGTGGNAPLTYAWSFGDGETAAAASVRHVYASPGAYTATCLVTDADGDTASDSATVTVSRDELPAVVAAAAPPNGVAPLTVQLTATASGGDAPLAFVWDFGDGTSSALAAPAHDYGGPGTYTALVTVTDADGDRAVDSVTIVVGADSMPTVAATASPPDGVAPFEVRLTPTIAGGNPPWTITWDLGDGRTSTQESPAVIYAPGTWQPSVTVVDADGDVATAQTVVTVAMDTLPAIDSVTAVSDPSGYAPLAVAFTCNATGGNPPLRYAWSFGDGATATGADASHTYNGSGTYTAVCVVTDADGDDDSESYGIAVVNDERPNAFIQTDVTDGEAPLAVRFFAAAGGGNAPLAYSWDLGDGSPLVTDPDTTHVYATPGDWVVTLRVSDVDGDDAVARVTIRVRERDDPPTAAVTAAGAYLDPSGAFALRGQRIDLDAAGSTSGQGQDDAGDAIVSYNWSFDRLPPGSAASFSNAWIANPTFTPDVDGEYVVRLTVRDLVGHTGSAARAITSEWGCLFPSTQGSGQSAEVATALSSPLVASVTTLHGIPAAAVEIAWSSSDALVPPESVTDGSGTTSVSAIAGTRAGPAVITAAVSESPGCAVTFGADLLAGPRDHIEVVVPPDTSVEATPAILSGRVVDRFGNAVSSSEATVWLTLTNEEQPFVSSAYFSSVNVGSTTFPVGSPGNRFIVLTTSGGAFEVGLDTADYRAEWYEIDIFDDSPGTVVSTWQTVFFDDFETNDLAWYAEGDWELGAPTSGPGAAWSGSRLWATRLAGNHDLQSWGSRRLGRTFDFGDLGIDSEVRLSFQHWVDAWPGDDGCSAVGGGVAGGRLLIDGGPDPLLQPAPPYTVRDCDGQWLWSGTTGGWQNVTLEPLVGLAGRLATIDWQFRETANPVARPGWYVDDVRIEARQRNTFRARFTAGAPHHVFVVPVDPGAPDGLVGAVGCAGALEIAAIVLDQFDNLVTADSTTRFTVSIDGSGWLTGGGATGGGWGRILAGDGTNLALVEVEQGFVLLSAYDSVAENVGIVTLDTEGTGLDMSPAMGGTFVLDSNADGDPVSAGCGDCDDMDPTVFPGQWEACSDGRDNDCNGAMDCGDSMCAGTPACPFGSDLICGNGGTVMSPPIGFSDNLCAYADHGSVSMCSGAGGGGPDVSYAFQIAQAGSYRFCVFWSGFAGSVMLGLNDVPGGCQLFDCRTSGTCMQRSYGAGDIATVIIDSDGGCGMVDVMVESDCPTCGP